MPGEGSEAIKEQEGRGRMVPKGRAVVVILGVVAVGAIVLAGVAIGSQIRERNLRQAKERELSLVKAEKKSLEQELNEIRQAKEQVDSELSHTKEQLTQAAQQLTEERKAKETLAASVDDRQREVDRLGKDLEQLRVERDNLTQQAAQFKDRQDKLLAQLTEVERAKGELEAKVLELSQGSTVELGKVVVKNSDPGVAPPAIGGALQGQVIVVNREYDFIVVNLGKNHGLTIGQEFQIVRGEEVLGRAKVEKVYDELSAAAILPESKKDAIREGDLVKAI